METRTVPVTMLTTMLLAVLLAACGKQDTKSRSERAATPATRLSGGMNEWLSDGTMGIIIHEFGVDPTGPTSSPVTYYRIGFRAKNFTRNALQLDKVTVKFSTTDSEARPFQNEISWSRSLDAPRASQVPHVIGPLDAERLESSGHFYFGKTDPSVTITFSRGETVVGGPFRVTLGPHLPR